MSWLDTAIEQAGKPVEVDIKDLNFGVDTLQALPLSAHEYQVLKADPEASKLSGEDRNEYLGIRMVYEMLAKCDPSLSWGKFRQLPVSVLGELANRVSASVGTPDGGGALGES